MYVMTAKTSTYIAKELDQIFNNSPDFDVEGGQAHQVFLELKRRVESGLTISFTESLYFYYGVKYAIEIRLEVLHLTGR